MKKSLCTIAMAAVAFAAISGVITVPVGTVNASGDVEINETNFPDENFRKWVNNHYGEDNVLSQEEIAETTYINVDNMGISSLEGISYFTSLERLFCAYNNITSLDLSNCPNLTYLDLPDCKITSLDLSHNNKLYSLACANNRLEYLNIKNCTELVLADCGRNKLTDLDVSTNTALKEIYCYSNKITGLDVSKNAALERLSCQDNQLTDLDVSKNAALDMLSCEKNQLTILDVSKNSALTDLYCNNNQLTSLDVSMNHNLDILKCCNNPFTEIYLAKEPDIFDIFECDDSVNKVVLTASDWKYTGVQWIENYVDPSKTTATALFECTKEGATDYKVSEPMTVKTIATVKAGCEEDGSVSFEANLPAEWSRTGKEITDTKAIKTTDATGHSWGEWQVTKKATVASEGEETRICKNDPSHKQTRKIARLTPTPTAKPTAKPANNAILTLNKKSLTIVCGKTDFLKATLKGATGKITWKSSDKKIATVDSNGKITTKQAGAVTITATAAGKSASCKVTVLYKDVTNPKDFWYAPTNYLTAKGVVKGYDKQTKFKPANDCTRAQMLTFMWRLQGEPAPKAKTCKFPDVKKTDYFFKPVIWAVEQGITTGVSKTKFDPQGVCTRAQTVTFLWRMAQKPAPKAKTCKFKDVKVKDYFYKPVIWASEKKIVAGYSDGTFKPQGKCLRRQMVTFLYKYDKYINKKG